MFSGCFWVIGYMNGVPQGKERKRDPQEHDKKFQTGISKFKEIKFGIKIIYYNVPLKN